MFNFYLLRVLCSNKALKCEKTNTFAEMGNKSHEKQLLFLRGAQTRSCNNFINNRLIVSVRPSSCGCTREVAKHGESVMATQGCAIRFSSFSLCSLDIYLIEF